MLACRSARIVGRAVVTTVASRPIMNPAIDPVTSVTRWRAPAAAGTSDPPPSSAAGGELVLPSGAAGVTSLISCSRPATPPRGLFKDGRERGERTPAGGFNDRDRAGGAIR